MTTTVVEVGPHTIRGANTVDARKVSEAIAAIDDPIALLDDQPVDCAGLWRDVLLDGAAGADSGIVIVPTWWSTSRVDMVTAAAAAVFSQFDVRQRATVLSAALDDDGVMVVELSAEFVVLTTPGSEPLILTRDDAGLSAHLASSTALLVDTPAGVSPLSAGAIAELRRAGVAVRHSSPHRIRRAAAEAPSSRGTAEPRPRLRRRGIAVAAGAALTAAAAGGGWVAQNLTAPPGSAGATRVLTEGQVALRVPAHWTIDRVTDDTGSARVRISAPGGLPALHVTQSTGPSAVAADDVAASLRRAIELEEPGVFTDFDRRDTGDGRPAVTYVEHRRGSQTRWTVLVDGQLRIAVGCQAQVPQQIEDVCAQAVASAHAVV